MAGENEQLKAPGLEEILDAHRLTLRERIDHERNDQYGIQAVINSESVSVLEKIEDIEPAVTARLAHLEAIEAAAAVIDEMQTKTYNTRQMIKAEAFLQDLIRKGPKGNE